MDTHIIRGRIRFSLWITGVLAIGSLLITWSERRAESSYYLDPNRFILAAVATGGLIVSWFALLIAYHTVRVKIKREAEGGRKKPLSARHPHLWMLKYVAAALAVAVAFGLLKHYSDKISTSFNLLEEGKLDALRRRIESNPAILEQYDRKTHKNLLQLAVEADADEATSLLLELGAKPRPPEIAGDWLAAALRRPRMLNVLLDHGISPDLPDANGNLPLLVAVKTGNVKTIGTLLDAGARIDAPDPSGKTPLMMALLTGNLDAVLLLTKRGADPNHYDRSGNHSLHLAVATGFTEAIEPLLEKGADPALRNIDGETPIHVAAKSGNLKAIELLLAADPDLLELADEAGRTPFELSVRAKRYEAARLLLEKGANVDPRRSGNTLLYSALTEREYGIAEFLINEGADVRAESFGGETPLDVIRKKDLVPLLELLGETSADAADEPEKGGAPEK